MTTQPRVLRGQFPQSQSQPIPQRFGNPQQHQFSPNPAFSPRHTARPSSSPLHQQQFYQPAMHEMYKGPGVSSTPPMMGMIVRSNVEKHSVKMMAELNRMKEEKDHCDFLIQVGNDVYYAHKNVLSAGSDYFRAMLKHDTKESREGKVVFRDVNFKCVKNCVDFIYSGKLEITDQKMNDLLHVAIMLQLEDVKQIISDILEESITVKNYFSSRNIADMYGLDAVLSRCRVFFHANIMEISNQPEFGNIAKIDILNFVKLKKSELCEEELLMLLLNWVEKNRKNEKHLQESLDAIKLDKISPAFLEQLLESNLIIRNDFGLYKLLNGYLVKALKSLVKTKEEIDNDESINLFDDDRCTGDVELKTTANAWKPLKRDTNSKRSQEELDTLQPQPQQQFYKNGGQRPRSPGNMPIRNSQLYYTPQMMSHGYQNVLPPTPSQQYYHYQSPQTLQQYPMMQNPHPTMQQPGPMYAQYGFTTQGSGKREKRLIKILDPSTSQDITNDIMNSNTRQDSTSTPSSGRSSVTGTPPITGDVAAKFAAQVAAAAWTAKDSTSTPPSGRSSVTGTPPIG